MKSLADSFKKQQRIHGNICLGKFVPHVNSGVSLTYLEAKPKFFGFVTVEDVDLKSVSEIA